MRAVVVLIALAISAFTFVTTETLPIGLLLLIAADLNVTQVAAGMLVTCYGLVVVVASVPLTLLTRRMPRRVLLPALLGVFVVFTVVSVATTSYWVLLAARMVIALSQALFWSVVMPTAASLFPPNVTGRALSVVFAGSSLAAVLGVPVGTWLGERLGWQAAFLALTGLGVLTLVVIAALLPSGRPEQAHSARGTAPDSRRYWLLMTATTLAVTGAFTAFTYVTPFLTEVAAFSTAAIGPLLLLRGVAGIAGVGVGGLLVDRNPWGATVTPVVVQVVALLGVYVVGDSPVLAAGLVALAGLAFSALAGAVGTRTLQIAPGSTDLASAGSSTAFNIGITCGALLGGVLLSTFGVRTTALAGGLLSVAALAVVLTERLLPAPRPSSDTSSPVHA